MSEYDPQFLADVYASMQADGVVPPIYNADEHPLPENSTGGGVALAPPPPPPPAAANHPLGPALTEADAAKFLNTPASPTAWHPPDPLAMGGPKANAPGAGVMTGYDPLLDKAQVNTPAPAPQGAPNVGATPTEGGFPLSQISGGGVIPAHEVGLLGPTQLGQQGVMNATAEQAIGANTANSRDTAQREYETYLKQERDAHMRQAAMEQSAAEREEELQSRQADFDTSVKQLSKMSLDPDRFWATRSTGQKIGAMISIALGGFVQGARGGSNAGMDIINGAIERDIRAQEFAYHVAHDVTSAKQTAFSMAMQKYNNVDAARAMARASALDAVQAQLAQNAAMWKDTDAANRGNAAIAELESNKMNQALQFIKFLPATSRGRMWRDEHGLLYTEDQARSIANKIRDNQFEAQKQVAGIGGQVLVEGAKANAAALKDQRAEIVTLPNGEEIRAPSAAEATTLRGIATGVNGAQALVAEAREIRKGTQWRVPYTADHERLKQIQGELQVSTKDRASLGALSGPDMGLVNSMIGDLTSQSPVVDKTIGSFEQHTNNALRARVKTIAGAPANAKGELSPAAQKSLGGYSGK